MSTSLICAETQDIHTNRKNSKLLSFVIKADLMRGIFLLLFLAISVTKGWLDINLLVWIPPSHVKTHRNLRNLIAGQSMKLILALMSFRMKTRTSYWESCMPTNHWVIRAFTSHMFESPRRERYNALPRMMDHTRRSSRFMSTLKFARKLPIKLTS